MSEAMVRITNLMKEQGLTGKEICSRLGLAETNFTMWKKGRDGYKIHLPEIASILGCSVEYLVTGEESAAERLYRAYCNAPADTREGVAKILGVYPLN